MSGDSRYGAARTARDALAVEIELRERELAALVRSLDILDRALSGEDACDRAAAGGCGGELFASWCRGCGYVARRCTIHGAARAATTSLRHHHVEAHGGGYARAAATEDAGGLRAGAEALPMGGLQAPHDPRGAGGRGADDERASDPNAAPGER